MWRTTSVCYTRAAFFHKQLFFPSPQLLAWSSACQSTTRKHEGLMDNKWEKDQNYQRLTFDTLTWTLTLGKEVMPLGHVMPVPERSCHWCFKVANPIYFIVHIDINVFISGLMPRGHVGILTLRFNCCVCVCVCVCGCVCVCVGHRWQHLRLSVRLSSVKTEAHQAVLTCNSDELCKSSMKLNLRLGPQHTHTHTRSTLWWLPW